MLITTERLEEMAEVARYDAKELARLCCWTGRHLRRQFRRCLGRSPQDWLNERRIIASRELLLSGKPVKVVAIELGFKHASHFCRQFKLFSDTTPSEFVSLQADAGWRSLTDNRSPLSIIADR